MRSCTRKSVLNFIRAKVRTQKNKIRETRKKRRSHREQAAGVESAHISVGRTVVGMNLTESEHSKLMVGELLASQGDAGPGASSGLHWRSCLIKAAVLALGYGLFAVTRRFRAAKRDDVVDRGTSVEPSRGGSVSPAASSSGEVCPICLEPPRSGVRTGCGHRLCARCLVRYCEVRLEKSKKPPPCPFCRTPLVSVTLTYDQNVPPAAVDPATARWIRKFNARGGLPGDSGLLLGKSLIACVLFLVLAFIAVAARFQILAGIDLVAYSSFFITAFGTILLIYLWRKCIDQADLEDDY